MTKTLLKSSPTNRLDAIVEGLFHASNMALKHADMPLSRMPEYFMAVHVAQHIAKSFANFGYRLEASVKQTLSDAGVDESEIDDLLKIDDLRGNGRFDLVLRTDKRGMPAHVMEFKRGSRSAHLAKDLIRLAHVTKTVHAGARLETNYLVFTTKKSQERLLLMLQAAEAERRFNHPRARGQVSCTLKRYHPIPHWAKDDDSRTARHMAVAVFEVRYKS
ncbi:hypothetical protein [Pseudomonas lactis]|uniref:hypothetical protein n=1 Tax=Pseudomonas lactis TaxID=1615674 RepID=UPI00110C830A|nr:hypothetical protein [Pseudomonas lactis]MBK3446340.1 hypothetical protein [Pseudomonas lactis]